MGFLGDFFTKKKSAVGKQVSVDPVLDWLKVDIHNHILPGIDDGSPDVETSLEFLKRYHQLGIETVVATSHIRHPLFPNNNDSIRRAWELLESAPGRKEIPVKLLYSAEYFIDDHFLDIVTNDDLMPFGGGYVLAELSLSSRSYLDMEQIAAQLISKGIQPILAHPERYLYWSKSIDMFQKLRSYGWLLQLNMMSLAGYYGKIEQKVGIQLLDEGSVDLLGTDVHKLQHFDVIASIDDKLMEQLKRKYFLNKLLNV
jgi:tyrosine-protein phosphatase YwqE